MRGMSRLISDRLGDCTLGHCRQAVAENGARGLALLGDLSCLISPPLGLSHGPMLLMRVALVVHRAGHSAAAATFWNKKGT
jgi:hypothetical protein